MNNEESKLGLYEHNKISYEKIKQAFLKEDVVGIVHATGTGKTYNALQLAYDNKDKKIIFVVPSTGIIEHIEKIVVNIPKFNDVLNVIIVIIIIKVLIELSTIP